jgi:hypothetical protein
MANVILFTANAPRQVVYKTHVLQIENVVYPAGAFAIASHLRNLGYSVLVIPHCLRLSLSGVKKIIENNKKELLWVGISTTLMSIQSSSTDSYRNLWHTTQEEILDINLLFNDDLNKLNKSLEPAWGTNEVNAIAKELQLKNTPLMIGGAWVTSITNGNYSNLEKNIHLVTGNAEKQCEELSRTLSQGMSESLPLFVSNEDYDNGHFRQSKYAWTDNDLVDEDDWVPIEISRGCAFNCAYCSYDRKSTFDSYKDPVVIREQLIELYEKYGVTKFLLVDDLYNDSKKKVRIMYDQVWSKLPFTPEWTSYLRLDMFYSDPESIQIIKDSGCRIGSFGIETMNDRAGSKVGKGLGRARIISTLENLKRIWGDDVLVAGMFIMGLPGESVESMMETAEWLKTTDLLYSYSATPLWITPPEHKKFILKHTPIVDDYNKYGITWTKNEGWKNECGVTYKIADEIAKSCVTNSNMFAVSFSNYPEFRTMGFSHEDFKLLKRDPDSIIEKLKLGCKQLNEWNIKRTQNFLSIADCTS